LIDWLKDPTTNAELDQPVAADGKKYTYELGDGTTGYTIDYYEVTLASLKPTKPAVFSNLSGVHGIVCMSTHVGEKAAASTKVKPIVVITSDPTNNAFDNPNVCGVCAIRPQLIGVGLRKFISKSGVKVLFGLNRDGYKPSKHSKRDLGKRIDSWIDISDDNDTDASIASQISDAAQTPGAGLLVLPADRFFGLSDDILAAAGNMPTYWTTTDWPAANPKGGGYGYPQEVCGQYMAQRIASVWSSSSGIAIPAEPFLTVDPKFIKSIYKGVVD
jgi:hypothetical protein